MVTEELKRDIRAGEYDHLFTTEIKHFLINWNPETDSVTELKAALEKWGGDYWALTEEAYPEHVVRNGFAAKYKDISCCMPALDWMIWAIDHEGNCLICDEKIEIKHVSEL